MCTSVCTTSGLPLTSPLPGLPGIGLPSHAQTHIHRPSGVSCPPFVSLQRSTSSNNVAFVCLIPDGTALDQTTQFKDTGSILGPVIAALPLAGISGHTSVSCTQMAGFKSKSCPNDGVHPLFPSRITAARHIQSINRAFTTRNEFDFARGTRQRELVEN